MLTAIAPPGILADKNLHRLVIGRMVNLSLEHGNSDGSCFAYVVFAIIAGPRFGNYDAGFRFGQLGYDLVEKRGLKCFQAGTCSSFGYSALPWTKHVRTGRDLVRRAFKAANEVGDLVFAAFCCHHVNTNLIAAGDPELRLISQHHAELSSVYRVTVPPWEIGRWAHDKQLTYQRAAALGIDYPKSYHELSTDPRYKGKIAYVDPKITGEAAARYVVYGYVGNIWQLSDFWSLYNNQSMLLFPGPSDPGAVVDQLDDDLDLAGVIRLRHGVFLLPAALDQR